MNISREELFREWVESWAEDTGLGVPCKQAQADGAPCFELGRDCAECKEGFDAWLEFRLRREGSDGPGIDEPGD